jgi:hypothetical protein
MQNLIFFDKEGNPLNFFYNEGLERYEGDILFPENSEDTFKTQALYLFEKIPAFEYENQEHLTLRRFQLFNEYGFHFYQGVATQSITKIEPVNQESTYYSKWIYGKNIEATYPLGTFIRFNTPIFEFTDLNRTYCVISSKKGSIMIISLMDNNTFDSNYNGFYGLTSSYEGVSISGVDIIGIYNYITPDLRDTLSLWNEPTFYDRIYQYRKLNIVNTSKNDNYSRTNRFDDVGVVTIKNANLFDVVHLEYFASNIPQDTTLVMEVVTKTDLPRVYRGPIAFDSVSKTLIFGDPIPSILKPGIEFKVPNSSLNLDFFKVAPILSFNGNVNLTYYATGSQVIYDNKIYQCIQAYTWSGATDSIGPSGSSFSEFFWTDEPTYLPIEPSSTSGVITTEYLVGGEIYLTTDHIYFTQSYTQSGEITFASAAERFKEDFKLFNIDLFYDNNRLKADLIYPSNYVNVNFYHTQKGETYSIGGQEIVYEKAIETYERLNKEFNYNYSSNWSYNIVFTDIDEFGIIIKVNKMVYGERIAWVYSSGLVDMQRTIDRTLRNWLTRHFISLTKLGIMPNLVTVGYSSVYYNSINLSTDFPNVPIDFSVQVGTTADFYIEHTVVVFDLMGKFLSVKINGRTYEEIFDTDIPTTLSNWVESWGETINDFGIFVDNSASALRFNVKKQRQRVSLEINVGLSTLPGIDAFRIIEKYSGNFGSLITSNEILLGTASGESLEEVGFATGQVVGINKTYYPLQNIEFNSLYLNPDIINLSYEGPFWGLTDSLCNSSAFTTVAFTIGFGQTGCPPSFSPSLIRGMYDKDAFTSSFSIEYFFTNTYTPYQFDGVNNMVDIVYIEPVNSIYVLGDTLRVFDSRYAGVLADIQIPGLTQSIGLCFNNISNYLFALSKNVLYKVDPYINLVIASYSFAFDAYSLQLNTNNGDVYVSFENSGDVLIYPTSSSVVSLNIGFNSYNMVFNDFESSMYIATDGAALIRVNGNTRTIFTTYPILVGTNSVAYDPENEAVYAFSSNLLSPTLNKVDNNSVINIPTINTGSFNSLLFNNFNSTMNSSTDISFDSIFVDTDIINYTTTPSEYGYQALNQFDGDIYIGGNSKVLTIDSTSGLVKNSQVFSGGRITKLIYNPDRLSIWGIQPDTEQVIEIQVTLSSFFQVDNISSTASTDNFFGTLSPDYIDRDYLWLNVREYIRRPRENFNDEPVVSLYWKWFSDNVPQFFMYDFTGNQLTTTGKLSYTGPKPLTTTILNRRANRDIDKVSSPEFQQTIFDYIEEDLEYIDDNFDVSVVPEPIQLFMGFNSKDEGALRSVLQLYKKEEVDFTITPTLLNNDVVTFETIIDEFTGETYGKISLQDDSTSLFTFDILGNRRGLKKDQHLAIFIKDITNQKNQYISNNNGYLMRIRDIFSREIIVDYFKEVDRLETEKNIIEDFPKSGNVTYLSCRFKVWNKEIGRFNLYAQTEIEDERYHIELNNVGKLVSSDDVYIFKEYDIKEEGIDWNYLNTKRKEMLMMKNLIYPYIGSYKSIINAINYFGYNDLQLNEYYRNVDIASENYTKLFKVEIPDIFDNTVEGWTDNDFIKHTFPNPRYEDTNLLNLTYRITDKEGNNVLYYTLEEVQKKLQGLKYWLQKNIIPITHKILDITGRADFVGVTTIVHQSRDAQIMKVNQNFTPITFNMNEAYLLPVNNGSTVYNCVLDFTINKDRSDLLPDYYTIDIRTYEIYREWYAFRNYQIGERVVYYDKLYESVINNNKTNNPRKFENAADWVFGVSYKLSDVVKYDRLFYIWIGQGGATFSSVSPVLDEGVGNNWLNITEWKQIDLFPVDKITEYRNINNLNPFNFTIDSNITPYLVIEVTSDNGYGMIYRDRKNFEVKGILDIQEIEAFTNLTTKQYRDATTPVIYVDVDKVADLNMVSLPFTRGFLDPFGNLTDRPYLNLSSEIVYPRIKHGYPYIIGNSSSFGVNTFRIEFTGDYVYLQNPYVVTSSGTAYVSGSDLYWNGYLSPGSTVSVELRGDVAVGGRSYWIDPLNSDRNQALMPLTYSILAQLSTGQNYGSTFSTTGLMNPKYRRIYQGTNGIGYPIANIPSSVDDLFTSMSDYSSTENLFVLSTFSQHGVNIVLPSDNVQYSQNFTTVVDGFYQALKSFGYVYYQNRATTSRYFPSILLSTYYEVSSTQSVVLRYIDLPPLFLAEVDNILTDNPLFGFGTNSTVSLTTITQSYYPS